jgi:hypothetical protein
MAEPREIDFELYGDEMQFVEMVYLHKKMGESYSDGEDISLFLPPDDMSFQEMDMETMVNNW